MGSPWDLLGIQLYPSSSTAAVEVVDLTQEDGVVGLGAYSVNASHGDLATVPDVCTPRKPRDAPWGQTPHRPTAVVTPWERDGVVPRPGPPVVNLDYEPPLVNLDYEPPLVNLDYDEPPVVNLDYEPPLANLYDAAGQKTPWHHPTSTAPAGGQQLSPWERAAGQGAAPSCSPWERALDAPVIPCSPWERALDASVIPCSPWERALDASVIPCSPWERATPVKRRAHGLLDDGLHHDGPDTRRRRLCSAGTQEVPDLGAIMRSEISELLDLIPPPPASLVASMASSTLTTAATASPTLTAVSATLTVVPATFTAASTAAQPCERLVAARPPYPKASSGGREPANLTTVPTSGGAATASSSSSAVGLVSAIPRATPVPRASPTEASAATCPGRQARTALRRCGADGAPSTATPGLLSTALAAALPTESATSEAVFVFTATAEANAAVARGCAPADQQAAPSNAKKRAAEEELAEPAVHPVLQVTKRARCDVVDVPLARAVKLLVKSGAKLIHRTSTLRKRRDLADWTMAETGAWTLDHPLRYVPLDSWRQEYRDVENEFANSCRGKNFAVTRICRVENDRLLYQFQERVRELERRCGDVAVLRVYHGTLRDNVPSIAIGNLDKRLAGLGTNHFYWGEGVNFSPISYYASHYGDVGRHRSMIVCDVVVGRACSVRQPGKEAPVIAPRQHRGCQPGQRYDTNMKLHPGPQVICKFDDHQFYPAYIVDYTAPARGHRGQEWEEEYRPWWYLQSIDLWTNQTVPSRI